ncbi:unnamed protein product [Cunninghamella echinulata]
MIHKYWNVKLCGSSNNDQYNSDLSHLTATELLDHQLAIEEKVYRIWTVLTTFEDSSAACISEMLFHVSEGNYGEGTHKADFFIAHVDVLFCAIDELATNHMEILKVELNYDNEARMLCKKVTSFFSLLSHSQVGGLKRIGGTEDLVSSVTGLAQYLKVLIRLGLTSSLKLENTNNLNSGTIFKFLSQLVKVANICQYYDLSEYTVTSDICHSCQDVCDTQSYYYGTLRWHDKCFACSQCCLPLGNHYQNALLQTKDVLIFCKECGDKNTMVGGFQKLTKLQQLSFNLRVALKRLHLLLDVPVTPKNYYNEKINPMYAQLKEGNIPNNNTNTNNGNNKFNNETPEPQQQKETVVLSDIKRTKSTHMNRNNSSSRRVAKRSTLMETPSPTSAFITTQQDDQDNQNNNREITSSPTKLLIDIQPKSPTDNNHDDHHQQPVYTTTPISLSPTSTALPFKNMPPLPSSQDPLKQFHKSRFYYFAELGSLDHYMLKHIAVLYLEEILKDQFTLEELAYLIDDKKQSTLWGKFVAGLKQGGNKKIPAKEGTFGVPLEILVEKYGVESNYGASPTRLKIPCIIEDSISAMKKMDMSVEGIFRKNGNIRLLKDLSEEIDKNPTDVNYTKHNAIQLAALIKKFLRELPEPLLTFKLHKLFTTIQKLENESDKIRAMHLACCLLPKANRDTMEVLFLFLRWVSTFANNENGGGNKMDLHNITIMIAPNILYSKSKDPMKDESFGVIEAVSLLLQYQEQFIAVPEDFVPLLENLNYGEGDMELSVRNILKKCEVVMKMTRTQSAKHDQIMQQPTPPPLPRQHSSPAAVPTTSTILSSSPPPPPSMITSHTTTTNSINSYPIPITTTTTRHENNNNDTNIMSPSSLPSSYCLSPSSMTNNNNNNINNTNNTILSHQELNSSTPTSPTSPTTVPPLPPVPLLRSQSSSQFDTSNNSLHKNPSLLV